MSVSRSPLPSPDLSQLLNRSTFSISTPLSMENHRSHSKPQTPSSTPQHSSILETTPCPLSASSSHTIYSDRFIPSCTGSNFALFDLSFPSPPHLSPSFLETARSTNFSRLEIELAKVGCPASWPVDPNMLERTLACSSSSSNALLVILGHTSDRETLDALILLTILVIFLPSVGSLLISALKVGAAIITIHGAFRMSKDLFLDDKEPSSTGSGLLSFLGGATTSTSPVVGI